MTIADGAGRVDRGAARAARARARARTSSCASGRCAQTAHAQNRPLWERLEALGIESGRLGLRARQQRRYALRTPCRATGAKPGLGRLTRGDVPAANP